MICMFLLVLFSHFRMKIQINANKRTKSNNKSEYPQVGAHRQAWAWQDEWYGLTMENIREFERETQILLQRKMGLDSGDDDEDGKFSVHHHLKINKKMPWFSASEMVYNFFCIFI